MEKQECPECNGSGVIYLTKPRHSTRCTGHKCASNCPQPEQVIERCDMCWGAGDIGTESLEPAAND